MTTRRSLLLCLALLLGFGVRGASAQSFEWNVVERDGKDYLTGSDLQRYFRFAQYDFEGGLATWDAGALVMRARVRTNQLLVGDVLFNLTDQVEVHGNDVLISRLDFDKLLRPILQPDFIAEGPVFDTVVIDPGHGGHDAGAVGNGVREKERALHLGLAIGEHLRAAGLNVVYTRQDDRFITLGGRVEIANRHQNAIFLSLHYNSASRLAARGIETFALSPQGVAHYGRGVRASDQQASAGNARDAENIALATAIHGALRRATDAPDRGIRRARWHVLSGLRIPGILIEGGFISNSADARLLRNDNYIDRQALAIARGVINYRRAIAGRRSR